MTDLEKAARQALEDLKGIHPGNMTPMAEEYWNKAITALRRALEQPAQIAGFDVVLDPSMPPDIFSFKQSAQQEPYCYTYTENGEEYFAPPTAYVPDDATPLYTRPQAREPLTDEQKDAARWRFLVDNSFDKDGVTQFHVWEHSWEPHSQTGETTEWKQRVRGPALDRFIDRAIEAAHGIMSVPDGKGDA